MEKNSISIIPTRKNARNKHTKKPWLSYREKQISEIKGLGGDELARSIVETAFSRWKRLFGPSLKSRQKENQTFEAKIKCHILNKMRLDF